MLEVWLRYGRRLVAGLTFQLAADITGTPIAPSWREVGQLGAIALIQTFLNLSLTGIWLSFAIGTPNRSGLAESELVLRPQICVEGWE